MKRRTFAATAAASFSVASAQRSGSKSAIYEIRTFQLRNGPDNQVQSLSDFLRDAVLPALQKAGVSPVGAFTNLIAPNGPFITMLVSFPSLAAMEASMARLAEDKEFVKKREAFNARPGLSYVRYSSSLLRAFSSMPSIEVPAPRQSGPRVFELRTYESNNADTLRKKIGMFEKGEIAVFRRVGLLPVFFGETIVGANQPNLTYMLAFDDLAAREKNWRAFGADPEWQKLRSTPGLSDAEIVSNISSILLRPLPFSAIR
jgi:hypothetical protein